MLPEHWSAVAAPVKVAEPEVYTSVVVLVVCTNVQKNKKERLTMKTAAGGNKVHLDLIHNKNVTVILTGRRWRNDTLYKKVLN